MFGGEDAELLLLREVSKHRESPSTPSTASLPSSLPESTPLMHSDSYSVQRRHPPRRPNNSSACCGRPLAHLCASAWSGQCLCFRPSSVLLSTTWAFLPLPRRGPVVCPVWCTALRFRHISQQQQYQRPPPSLVGRGVVIVGAGLSPRTATSATSETGITGQ